MSKEQQQLKEQCEGKDIVIVNLGEIPIPMIIVPGTDRARELFKVWGWEDDCIGIAPPANPMELINIIPQNWKVFSAVAIPGMYEVMGITLPKTRLVLH